jgi:lipopolysaccharide/colanic/teichoic acid biosynthesis glycosyltransferase
MTPTVQTLLPTSSYTHHLRSKTARNGKVLIITGYDYYLQKRDFKSLLRTYQEVILVPRSTDDEYLLSLKVMPLLENYTDIHLVTNPQYDRKQRIIYELIARRNKSIRVTVVSDFCEHFLRKLYISEDQTEATAIPIRTFGKGLLRLKRAMDVLVSLVLMVLSWPIWMLSALKISLDSPGSVLYRQERVGWRNGVFRIVKFRSMIPNAEANGAVFSKKRDNRTFGYGNFMRITRIDELPQLFNVLKGELTLIGPRPERKIFTDIFDSTIPNYSLRHLVKPGISGYAQVMYPYGAGARDARHKLMYDLYYIKNWSLGLECRILLDTIIIVLSKRGR